MQGLFQRRKATAAPATRVGSPFDLPEPSDPSFPEALALYKERVSALAVANGLPPAGSRMANVHGIEWVVDGHAFTTSVMTMGHGIEGDDPRLLYPVCIPQNLSERSDRMVHEINLCTPKDIVPLDTMPQLRPSQAAPYSHSVDAVSDPSRILLFLDAARLHETAFAHELAHVWLDLVEGIEDYRVLKDTSETTRYAQVQLLQSFVLDFAVNDHIERRGFDLSPILDDRRKMLRQLGTAVDKGYRPPTPWEAVHMATLIAEVIVTATDALTRPSDEVARIEGGLPEVWALALELSKAVQESYPTSAERARCAIDRVLTLAFAHAGEHLDLDEDLIHVAPRVAWRDKWPDWLQGLPPEHKALVGKAMARQGVAIKSRWELSPAGGETWARFQEEGRDWTEPVLLPFRHPDAPSPAEEARRIMEISAMNRRRQEERMRPTTLPGPRAPGATMPGPTVGPTIPGLPMPGFPPIPGRRPYSTGLGRWTTQVRMEQMLAGESPYGYALDNPTTYTDPSGNAPQRLGERPPLPPGADYIANCCAARNRMTPWGLDWFYDVMQLHGSMDYKWINIKYDDGGNYNYGFVAACLGMPLYIALNGAGAYKYWKDPKGRGKHGLPFINYPYGNKKHGQDLIVEGYKDYEKNKAYINRVCSAPSFVPLPFNAPFLPPNCPPSGWPYGG